jgi:hypothetical protein
MIQNNHKLYISRDVTFIENKPYYQPNRQDNNQTTILPSNNFLFSEVTNQEQVESIVEEQIGELSVISSGGKRTENQMKNLVSQLKKKLS